MNTLVLKKIKKTRLPILRTLFLFKHFDPSKNLLLFSSPRGGSTWLSQILLTVPKTILIWEPINPRKNKRLRDLNFGWRQSIPENEKWKDAEDFFFNVLSGKELTLDTIRYTNFHRLIIGKQLLIKFVRANALLPWLSNTFHFKYLPIYLVRHPFAVVQSQLRHGAWNHIHPKYVLPDTPFNEPYIKHWDFIKSLSSLEEILVANWCFANKYTLENKRNDSDWITIFYENLIVRPEIEIDRIFTRWGVPKPNDIYKQSKEPSFTVKSNDLSSSEQKQIAKWKDFFNSSTISKMENVLNYFEISHYRSDSCYPLIPRPDTTRF